MVIVSLIASILIISPIKRLAKDASKVAEGVESDLDKKSGGLVVVREVNDLRASVLDMAEKIKRRSDYLKAFSSGVSHEFKTPLASIKGALEIISEHGDDMTTDVREKFENNIRLDLERLEVLTSRLLAMARAEAYDPTGEERIEAGEAVKILAQRFNERDPKVRAEVDCEDQKMFLAIDGTVLETVLINLWENSRENGAFLIKVRLWSEDGFGNIRVEDNGRGLSEKEAEKIFTPFYTTRRNAGGTGLGLSLARTLLTPYRSRLDWVGPAAVFLISIPLAKNDLPQKGDKDAV
jgi:K+-sensing histidine kinase KdpD